MDLQCLRVYGCCIYSVFPEDKYLGQSGGVEAVRNENARIAEEIQLLDQEMVRSFILVLAACGMGRCLFHWHPPPPPVTVPAPVPVLPLHLSYFSFNPFTASNCTF